MCLSRICDAAVNRSCVDELCLEGQPAAITALKDFVKLTGERTRFTIVLKCKNQKQWGRGLKTGAFIKLRKGHLLQGNVHL